MNWNLFLFFPIYLCSTSQRNAYNLFFRSLTFQVSVKSCSPSPSLHPAPCIGVSQLSASGLHALSSSLTPPFLVRQLYYYTIPSPVCLLYHTIPSLSMLLDVEDSRLFLSMICEKSIKRAFPFPKEKRSAPFLPKNNLLFDNFHIIRLQPRIHLHEISNCLRICHQLPIPLHTARL